jgi:hypothetical protein
LLWRTANSCDGLDEDRREPLPFVLDAKRSA